MGDIEYSQRGSILNPLKSLQFFSRRPVTEPLEPRLASLNYRGFHLNDWEKCIGCGTCQQICDNAAISMVHIPTLPKDEAKGVKPLRPAIDYGRCCWCGLCVDICPSSSLSLSREYVHTCEQEQLDSYFILPDPVGIHNRYYGHGWQKSESSDLLNHHREPMVELKPESRSHNFDEIVAGYTLEAAVAEASRCVQCGMCHDACPTQMHAPEYIRSIWNHDFEEAVRQIYRTNPFAHTCGRVCTHRCESACSVGLRGEAVAIRWLKRFAMDQVDLNRVKQIVAEQKRVAAQVGRIAIVGAGPAGLTAAYDLALAGHQVEVFEALTHAGGMTRYGIPEYRLPYTALDRDVEVITSLGVKCHYGVRIGSDKPLTELQRDFDAVLLAIGLQQGRSTRIKGSDHAAVQRAVDLLRQITLGEPFTVPRSAVVIGGGNVAMDIARSLARLQKQQYGQIQMTVTALEPLDRFMADKDEIKEALEEGITILDQRGPQSCEFDDHGVCVGLKSWQVVSIFDEQGRFAPHYNPEEEQIHPAEMVIEAIGQMSEVSLLGTELTEVLEWSRGRLVVDAGGRTSQPWLWAAGDWIKGPDVVSAVADGHRVAVSIQTYLEEKRG